MLILVQAEEIVNGVMEREWYLSRLRSVRKDREFRSWLKVSWSKHKLLRETRRTLEGPMCSVDSAWRSKSNQVREWSRRAIELWPSWWTKSGEVKKDSLCAFSSHLSLKASLPWAPYRVLPKAFCSQPCLQNQLLNACPHQSLPSF